MTANMWTQADLRAEYEYRLDEPGVYRNYGDVTPHRHGGLWIAYHDGHWDVVETVHPHLVQDDYPEDTPGHQHVAGGEAYFSDVVSPDGEWTGIFSSIPDKHLDGHDEPIGAVVDGRMTGYVAHELRAYGLDPLNRLEPMEKESYGALLDSVGVRPRE
jgi:hypothetical protein